MFKDSDVKISNTSKNELGFNCAISRINPKTST